MSNSLINTLQDFLSKQDIKVEQELLSASLRELNFSQTLELMKKIKEFDVEGVTSMVNVDYDSPVQNEWVQDSPAQGFSGQERNFIEELCLRMDGVSKSPEGLRWMGKSETWDEGNVLSDKGKLTTVMLWAKKNIDDLYHKMGSEFKVYSDGNDKGDSGRGQSDGNQIMQNIINKVGKIGEVEEAYGTVGTQQPSASTIKAQTTKDNNNQRDFTNNQQDQQRATTNSVSKGVPGNINKVATGQGAARSVGADPDDVQRGQNSAQANANAQLSDQNAQEIERLKQLAYGRR